LQHQNAEEPKKYEEIDFPPQEKLNL